MKWQQLLPKIQYAALHNAAPKAIVVHVGSNDLAYQKGVVLIHNMKDDLSNLVHSLAVPFSFLLCCLVLYGQEHRFQTKWNPNENSLTE